MDSGRRGKAHGGQTFVAKHDESGNKDFPAFGQRFRHGWNEFLDFCVPFFFDVAKGAAIILALFFFAWLLNFGKALNIKEERLDVFESIDFWAQVGTYSMVSFAFIRRLYRSITSEM